MNQDDRMYKKSIHYFQTSVLDKKKVIKCENDSPAFNTGSKNITYIFLTHFISFWTIKIIESQVFIGI